jgi:ubiquinone/menaquinone biosynthesis C-methylase UbiE
MTIKSYISGLLRKMNLLSSAEKTRFYLQKLKYRSENDAFMKEHPDFILPPEYFIYETYRLNYKWYYEDGKNTAEEIVTLFSRYYDLSKPGKRILDWGCGPGRIVRHLPALLPNTEIYGTDYNDNYIKWCSENLKGINFSVNKIDPPMSFASSFFDAIIGLSIFTHLSEKNHFDWINELYRISKFGGGVLITTQGEAYRSKLTAVEKELFDANQLVTRKYLNEGNRLYSSFQPVGFMKELIKGKFHVIEYVAGKIENNESAQDSWLLQKI